MFSNQEQISNATRSHVESQLALFASLSRHTFDSVEKFLDLNLNAARATMQESEAAARQLLTAKDAKEFFALSTAQRQPAVDKAISYGRHFAGIANSTRAGYSHLAETRVAEFNRRLVDMVENAAKNAPAG